MTRRVGLLFICAAVAPLSVAAAAWGCASLATLKLDTRSAAPGTTVTGTGTGYNAAYNVTVRLDSRTGPVLWEGLPNPLTRKIEPTFRVPSLPPGYYTIIATQYDLSGNAVSGTPGRAPLQVTGSSGSASAPPAGSAWGPPDPSGPGGAGGPLRVSVGDSAVPAALPTLAGALLSLMLLAAGVALIRRGRPRASDRLTAA